jgi:hypothetical protein
VIVPAGPGIISIWIRDLGILRNAATLSSTVCVLSLVHDRNVIPRNVSWKSIENALNGVIDVVTATVEMDEVVGNMVEELTGAIVVVVVVVVVAAAAVVVVVVVVVVVIVVEEVVVVVVEVVIAVVVAVVLVEVVET